MAASIAAAYDSPPMDPGRHVLILLENEPYPYDTRVRQEAEALAAAGATVTVCGPTGFGFEERDETIAGVRVLRYPAPPGGGGVLGYAREYAVSLLRLSRLVRAAIRSRRPDVVIVCTPPDLLVLAARRAQRAGAALVIDHHDLSPELFETKFGRRGALHRALLTAERFALGRADAVMATNGTGAEVAKRRAGVRAERVFLVRNGPDPARIHPVDPRPELRRGRERLVVWVGTASRQEGLGVLIDAADRLVNHEQRDVAFAIVGPGDARDALREEARIRDLDHAIDFPGPVGDAALREYLATADVCVGVDKPSPLNDAATMTKVLEYMAMGRPIVQFPLRETQRVAQETTLYARPGDAASLADRIAELLDDRERAEALGAAARRRALNGLMWPDQVPALLAAVEAALQGRAGAHATPAG